MHGVTLAYPCYKFAPISEFGPLPSKNRKCAHDWEGILSLIFRKLNTHKTPEWLLLRIE